MTSEKVTHAQRSCPKNMITSHHYNNRGFFGGYDVYASLSFSLIIIRNHDSHINIEVFRNIFYIFYNRLQNDTIHYLVKKHSAQKNIQITQPLQMHPTSLMWSLRVMGPNTTMWSKYL